MVLAHLVAAAIAVLGTGSDPRVATDVGGDAAVAWVKPVACHRATCTAGVQPMLAFRPARGRWGRPIALSPPRREVASLHLVMDAHGDALVAWAVRHREQIPGRIDARWRLRRGHLTPLQHVVVNGGMEVDAATLPGGSATLVWEQQTVDATGLPITDQVDVAFGSPRRPFGAPATLSPPAHPIVTSGFPGSIPVSLIPGMRPTIAAGPDGTLVAAWTRADGSSATCCDAIEATRFAFDAPSGVTARISTPVPYEDADAPAVALGLGGQEIVAWDQLDGTRSDCCLRIAAREAAVGGVLGPESFLSGTAPEGTALQPDAVSVAVGPGGSALLAWREPNPTAGGVPTTVLRFATASPAATFSAPQTLDPAPGLDATAQQIAATPSGWALVWLHATSTSCASPGHECGIPRHYLLLGTTISTKGAVSAPHVLAHDAASPQLAGSPAGQILVWATAHSRIRALFLPSG